MKAARVRQRKKLGVIGGMGPLATAHFLRRVAELTPATRDQEHIPVIVWGDCQVPDRVAAILGFGESPVPAMRRGLAALEQAGATLAAIVCNTAHHWFDDLVRTSSLPLVHIVDRAVASLPQDCTTVGLLATSATIRAGIYQRRLDAMGCATVLPAEYEQEMFVLPAIAAVKQSRVAQAQALVERASEALRKRGAQRIVLACTELSVVASAREACDIVDATDTLARACVAACSEE